MRHLISGEKKGFLFIPRRSNETGYTASAHNLLSCSVSLPSPAAAVFFCPLAQMILLNSLHQSHSHSVFPSLNVQSARWQTTSWVSFIISCFFLKLEPSFKLIFCQSSGNWQWRALPSYCNNVRLTGVLAVGCWRSWKDKLYKVGMSAAGALIC